MTRYRRIFRLLVTAAALTALAVSIAGCNGGGQTSNPYSVSGRVTVKGTDTGVPDATVSFESFGTTTTDSYGYWSKAGLKGSVNVSVAKHPWTFTPSKIPVTGGRSAVNFEGWELDYRALSDTAAWRYDVESTLANGNKQTGSITQRVDRVEESGSATLFYISSFSDLPDLSLFGAAATASSSEEYIIKKEGRSYYYLNTPSDDGLLLFTAPLSANDRVRDPIIGTDVSLKVDFVSFSGQVCCLRRVHNGNWYTNICADFFPYYIGLYRVVSETELPTDSPDYRKTELVLRSHHR